MMVAVGSVARPWLPLTAAMALAGGCGETSATGEATPGSTTGGVSGSGHTGGAPAGWADFADPLPPVLEFVVDVSQSMDEDAYPNDPSNNATKLRELERVLQAVWYTFPHDWAVGLELSGYAEGTGCYQGQPDLPIPLTATDDVVYTPLVGVTTKPYGPTGAAWRYAWEELAAFSDPAYADSDRSIVLITDGSPTVTSDGCTVMSPFTVDEYDAWISEATTPGPAGGVKTYVIGLPGSESPEGAVFDPLYMLSRLAVAGGTGAPGCTSVAGTPSGTTVSPHGTYCHWDLTSSLDFGTGLAEALRQVTRQATGAASRPSSSSAPALVKRSRVSLLPPCKSASVATSPGTSSRDSPNRKSWLMPSRRRRTFGEERARWRQAA